MVLIVVTGLWTVHRYLKWATTNFVITSDRVIYRSGIIAKSGIEIPLERVNNVSFSQGIFERVIDAGDLLIESGGEDGKQRFTDIRGPERVQNLIHAQMEVNETRRCNPLAATRFRDGRGDATREARGHGRARHPVARGVRRPEAQTPRLTDLSKFRRSQDDRTSRWVRFRQRRGAGDGADDPAVDRCAGLAEGDDAAAEAAAGHPGAEHAAGGAELLDGGVHDRGRRGEVVAQAAVAVGHHVARGAVVTAGERGGEGADALVLGDHVPGAGPHGRIVDGVGGRERGDAERSDHGLGGCALRDPFAVLGPLERALGDEADDDLDVVGHGDGVTSNVEQSMSRAWPSTADAMHSWSMMPVGTPVARCSARCPSRARSSGEPRCPNAIAAATSRAALDDRPAPTGMVVDTVPRMPVVAPSSAATAATYRPTLGATATGSPTTGSSNEVGSSSSVERQLDPVATHGVR